MKFESRSDDATVAVGFSPRMPVLEERRRVATLEAPTRFQASLSDANDSHTKPWAEAHGYHQRESLRDWSIPRTSLCGWARSSAAFGESQGNSNEVHLWSLELLLNF
jgi:hypothetical protein